MKEDVNKLQFNTPWFKPVNLINAYIFCFVFELLDFEAELLEQFRNVVIIDVVFLSRNAKA